MTSSPRIRRLIPGDEAMIDAFLAPHTASSLFLRSNLRRAGLGYDGQPLQGFYFGALVDGALVGVVAHYWNGNLLFQAPDHADLLAQAAVRLNRLPLNGLVGPWAQADAIREGFGIPADAARMAAREILFDLKLLDLSLPAILADGTVICRRSQANDLEFLLGWRLDYVAEALHEPPTQESRVDNQVSLQRHHQDGHQFVLEASGVPVASCTFNATLDEYVQIGGVWTPPDLRSRGYGRAVVAGALQIARYEGAQTAILFTDDGNLSAQAAYRALGFRQIGDYGLILFANDMRLEIGARAVPVFPEPQAP